MAATFFSYVVFGQRVASKLRAIRRIDWGRAKCVGVFDLSALTKMFVEGH
jgi:hypothetical protein